MAPLLPNMLIDPPDVRRILEDGWTKYFSIALLTNDRCRAVQFLNQVPVNTVTLALDGKFVVQNAGLSVAGESQISIEQWREASSRRFEQIKDQVDFAKHFNLYLQYDIYIRQMWSSCTAEFNPGVFHTGVYLEMWRTSVTSSLAVPRAPRVQPSVSSKPF
jgi:hypothetical protein